VRIVWTPGRGTGRTTGPPGSVHSVRRPQRPGDEPQPAYRPLPPATIGREQEGAVVIGVGVSTTRIEAWDKVSGVARYAADRPTAGVLRAVLVTSPHAHARIVRVETGEALRVPGVRAVVTGEDARDILCGEVVADRPPIARGKVRYHGEPVAVVVADSEDQARAGARTVTVTYEPLAVANSPLDALRPDAPLVHEDLGGYTIEQQPCAPEPGTNVADRARLRKGDMASAWAQADVRVEGRFTLPQLDHAAMETRAARAAILPDGSVVVHSATQAPFEVQRILAKLFGLGEHQVVVHAPLLGGAFGGKAAVQLEVLAYLASRAVRGRPVAIANTREEDLHSSPVGVGLEAEVRLGATRSGELVAADLTFHMDAGAYADSAPRVARAIASACTGPYRLENVRCDVVVVYTNHPYCTAFRSFGYMPFTFAIERAMDKLADALGIDPVTLRLRNAVRAGDTTPTRFRLTRSIVGDLPSCLRRAGELIDWDRGRREVLDGDRIVGRGIAALWKTSSSPQNAISSAIVTLNQDGSAVLRVGAVECGAATKTTAAQILSEALGLSMDRIRVHLDVRTDVDPEHWKTVASMGTFMVGRAVIEAARDATRQLKSIASVVLRCAPGDLAVDDGRVFLRDDPAMYLPFAKVAHGYQYADGNSIGGQVIGRGGYMVRHLTPLDPHTGEGMAGPSWTVGAQAVEIELDRRRWTYRLVRAVTVMDAGRIVNPAIARGMVMGGMCQGLGYATRECLLYDEEGLVRNGDLRRYKVMRPGEQPEYAVEFVETPQVDGPYGARPAGEHAIIGIPAAVANALSAASGLELDDLPVTPEAIWRAARRAGVVRADEPARRAVAGVLGGGGR